MQVLKCALCLTGFCMHPVKDEAEPECAGRDAVTMLSGTALCAPCATGRLQIETQLAWEERGRDAADIAAEKGWIDRPETPGNDEVTSVSIRGDGILRDQLGRTIEGLIGDEFG